MDSECAVVVNINEQIQSEEMGSQNKISSPEEWAKITVHLIEAVTVLCYNGLSYRDEFTMQGLSAITLDAKRVHLITINERIKSGTIHLQHHTIKEMIAQRGDQFVEKAKPRKRQFLGGADEEGMDGEPQAKKTLSIKQSPDESRIICVKHSPGNCGSRRICSEQSPHNSTFEVTEGKSRWLKLVLYLLPFWEYHCKGAIINYH